MADVGAQSGLQGAPTCWQESSLSLCYLCCKNPEEVLMMCSPLVSSNEIESFLVNQIPPEWVQLTFLERFPF